MYSVVQHILAYSVTIAQTHFLWTLPSLLQVRVANPDVLHCVDLFYLDGRGVLEGIGPYPERVRGKEQ